MRYKIEFSYDGSNYFGYQKQPNKPSIQNELEKALTKINGNKKVSVHSSGRTDAGVHALGQCAHFDMDTDKTNERLKNSLNKILPDDIYIKTLESVDESFDARFSVKKKEYIYKINIGEYDPLNRNYVYQYNRLIDLKRLQEGLDMFVGTYDFKAFTKGNYLTTVRTIFKATYTIDNNIVTISLIGNGFLRYMVRNIVGTLIEYTEGKYSLGQLKEIIESKDRTKAGKCAAPEGLYLKQVIY